MNSKKLQTVTETKIGSRVIAGVFILAGLVIGSLVFTVLLPGSDLSFLATAATKTVPVSGWCYTRSGLFVFDGQNMTKDACLKRATDADPNTKWYAFCPNITGQPPRTKSSCDYRSTDLITSALVQERVAQREQLIDQVNDGNFTVDDATHIAEFQAGVQLKLVCPIIFQIVQLTDPLKKDYEIAGIKGTAEFVKTVGKLFSRMNTKVGDICQIFPPTCSVSSSLRSCTCDKSDPKNSAHCCGEAADITCSDMVGKLCDTNQSSRDKIAAINAKIKAAGSVFVIRECYAAEKNACGDKSTTPVIHFDIKANHNTQHTPPCVYEGCDFTSCK